jgi:hypothetical protein
MPRRKVIVELRQKVKIWLAATIEFETELSDDEIKGKLEEAGGIYSTEVFTNVDYLESEYLIDTEEALSKSENHGENVLEVQDIRDS